MADWMLTGNGTPCPDCGGDGRRRPPERGFRGAVCLGCAGLGRVPLEPSTIVAAMLEEAKAGGAHG